MPSYRSAWQASAQFERQGRRSPVTPFRPERRWRRAARRCERRSAQTGSPRRLAGGVHQALGFEVVGRRGLRLRAAAQGGGERAMTVGDAGVHDVGGQARATGARLPSYPARARTCRTAAPCMMACHMVHTHVAAAQRLPGAGLTSDAAPSHGRGSGDPSVGPGGPSMTGTPGRAPRGAAAARHRRSLGRRAAGSRRRTCWWAAMDPPADRPRSTLPAPRLDRRAELLSHGRPLSGRLSGRRGARLTRTPHTEERRPGTTDGKGTTGWRVG